MTQAKREVIKAYSIDCDACVFNGPYYALYEKLDTRKDAVINANKKFLDTLKSEKANYKETIVFVGSIRQCIPRDESNSKRNRSESAFTAIPKIAQYLGARFDGFLIADVNHDLPAGTVYNHSTWTDYQKPPQYLSYLDDTKVTILYAQMHKLALRYPDKQIEFEFIDDRHDILEKLYNYFFKKHPELTPPNVTLQLTQYVSCELKPGVYRINPKEDNEIDMQYGRFVNNLIDAAQLRVVDDESYEMLVYDIPLEEIKRGPYLTNKKGQALNFSEALYEIRGLGWLNPDHELYRSYQLFRDINIGVENLVCALHDRVGKPSVKDLQEMLVAITNLFAGKTDIAILESAVDKMSKDLTELIKQMEEENNKPLEQESEKSFYFFHSAKTTTQESPDAAKGNSLI